MVENNMTIYEILKTIESDNSRNFKLDVLRKNKDNELLIRVTDLALNPMIQFYQRKIPNYNTSPEPSITLSVALNLLEELSSRTITGNLAIEHLTKILSSLSVDDAKVVERIIQKDLKCGVSSKTVNTVWSNLIPEYPCMLCSGYDDKLVSKIKFPAIVDVKMDGMRFNAIVKGGKVEFRSRNGKELNLVGYLESEFLTMADKQDVVYDGELVAVKDGKILDRQTGNGFLNKANKGTITEQEASMIRAVIWDRIPYNDFIKGIYKVGYSDRRFLMCNDLTRLSGVDTIRRVETHLAETIEEAQDLYQNYLRLGCEGIILKDIESIWENKRSKSQIKFKAELDASLVVVDIQMGTGKYEGMIGAIVCESSDGIIKVNVGSGLTDEQRKEFVVDSPVGKIVSVKYNAKIQAKSGEWSLFLPVFQEIRIDQDIADSFKRL